MMRAVTRMRARHERAKQAAVKRQQRADERAMALRAATSALARLKQVWHHAAGLEVALKSAEAATTDNKKLFQRNGSIRVSAMASLQPQERSFSS